MKSELWRAGVFGLVLSAQFWVRLLPAQDVKFGLSQVENLQLENYKLQRALLQCNVNGTNGELNREISSFVAQTLKAHGSPANVVFDNQNMEFKVQPEKKKP